MASTSTWLMLIDQWETSMTDLIKASQAAFVHEKYALQLHVATNPVPFRPSTVLAQLIQGEQRRGGSTKQHRGRTKNAEHLERKLESEVRQHYELETAQACAKWKKLHVHLMDDRRQLVERIEWDARQLGEPQGVRLSEYDESIAESALVGASTREVVDDAIEAERQRHLVESEWIHQERFNIQEAFTNQTKKIQADYEAFMDQLEVEFIAEREKIIQSTGSSATQPVNMQCNAKNKRSQFDRQFKSNAKRGMLVQTAPVVDVRGFDQSREPNLSMVPRSASDTTGHKSDLTQQDRQLQELAHRLAAFKEAANGRLKDGMQWIARQCAHMFSQLDCKEAEAKLVFMLSQQNDEEAKKLFQRVHRLTSQLRGALQSRSGHSLPPLPTLQPPPVCSLPATTPARTSERPMRRRSEPVGLKATRQIKPT